MQICKKTFTLPDQSSNLLQMTFWLNNEKVFYIDLGSAHSHVSSIDERAAQLGERMLHCREAAPRHSHYHHIVS